MTHLFAAPAAATAAPAIGAGGLASVTVALLVVLVVIFALAWIARRLRTFWARAAGALEILASMPLGAKERAVLVKVSDAQLLLGVAPGQVNTMHVLDHPVTLEKASAAAGGRTRPSFAALLKGSLGK
ncbi:MAG: Flagellar biosynthesis protein, FliO [Leptospirillum sp. Group IV 'UBA BS']|nr:MAG: Flagellar biosynthesis protein, FliO [Leptospirillum sp. Group IV 'UBA BS']